MKIKCMNAVPSTVNYLAAPASSSRRSDVGLRNLVRLGVCHQGNQRPVAVSSNSSLVASATWVVEVSLWFLRPRTVGAYQRVCVGAGATVGFNTGLRSVHSLPSFTRALPNPSLERTSTGKAPWPRGFHAYHPPRGQATSPVASAQLKR